MNTTLHRLSTSIVPTCGIVVLALLLPVGGFAFPPAPDHQIYGMVRDAMGEPIMSGNAVVILETDGGVRIQTPVVPNLDAGINYRLFVPMDAGLTSDNYKPTALRPLVPFRMKVIIGTTTNLPMELKGSYTNLGKPAENTRLDITLGEDSDGDGLPDAWERMLIEMLGGTGLLTLADIKPNEDADGDGMSNLDEYLAGTYAFDFADCLKLEIAGMREGRPLLDFLVIRGRSYAIWGCTNLAAAVWFPVNFRLSETSSNSAVLGCYPAQDVRKLRTEAELPSGDNAIPWVFRLQVR